MQDMQAVDGAGVPHERRDTEDCFLEAARGDD
jgi:hypothetical protein